MYPLVSLTFQSQERLVVITINTLKIDVILFYISILCMYITKQVQRMIIQKSSSMIKKKQVDDKLRGGYSESLYLLIQVLSANTIPFFLVYVYVNKISI